MLLIIHIYHNKRLVYALNHSYLPQQEVSLLYNMYNIIIV